MAEVKPAEVSAILREQLSGFKSKSELEEVGTVLQVGDGIARIYGLTNVQSGELIQFETGLKAIVLNLEEDNVGVVLLGSSKGIKLLELTTSCSLLLKNSKNIDLISAVVSMCFFNVITIQVIFQIKFDGL